MKQDVLRDIQFIETGKKRSIDRYPRKSDDIAQYCAISRYWIWQNRAHLASGDTGKPGSRNGLLRPH
jgi:hypothetical protein